MGRFLAPLTEGECSFAVERLHVCGVFRVYLLDVTYTVHVTLPLHLRIPIVKHLITVLRGSNDIFYIQGPVWAVKLSRNSLTPLPRV